MAVVKMPMDWVRVSNDVTIVSTTTLVEVEADLGVKVVADEAGELPEEEVDRLEAEAPPQLLRSRVESPSEERCGRW